MNDKQRKLLKMMLELDDRCARFGIDFSIGGGNALGAVRNGGFLPWDDDVDIYITRDNFEKMLAVRDEFFSEDFILVDYKSHPGYGNPLPRIVSTDDTVVSKSRLADGTPKGTFLELFVLDPMPNDPVQRREWLELHWLYAELVALNFRVAGPYVEEHVNLERYEEWLGRCNVEGRFKVLEQLEEQLFNIPFEGASELCARWGVQDCIYKASAFSGYTRIAFENVELPIAAGHIDNLYSDYGNSWMYIPKEGQRRTHKIVENMNVPYERFMEDCDRFIDEEKLSEAFHERKVLLVKIFAAERKNHYTRLALKAAAVRARLALEPLEDRAVDNALKTGDFGYLERRYGYWRSMQFSSSFWKWSVPVDIRDDELFCALAWLFERGEYDYALKILNMRQRLGGLGSFCQQLLVAVKGIEAVYRALGHRDLVAAQAAFAALEATGYSYWEQQFDRRYLGLYLQTRDDVYEGECPLGELSADVAALLVDYPESGSVASLAADIALLGGDAQGAQALYARALDKTRNAFTLRHARRRLLETEEDQR